MFYLCSIGCLNRSFKMSEAKAYEAQLTAMRTVMEALKPLTDEGREAVLTWVDSQLGRRQALPPPADKGAGTISPLGPKREGTVSAVAQKIGAKSARDLLLAAGAHLTLYQGRDSFSRDELIGCAKDARNWKAAYSNQMAFNIVRMLDAGTLFEKAKNVFSLSDGAVSDLEERLRQ
jgi:hypothetical protein